MPMMDDLAYARSIVERAFAMARDTADTALMEECIRLLRDLDKRRDDLLLAAVLGQRQPS
ncbi:hypothetical protein [Phreatobacter aquaticus]|jgi:hypothetical protein|uniref:hypothetical protein n=1 Tax=Phreatobacter aquaticus TaxID=2570229 RepID=UPI00143D13A4|nr:hypothetical protein [Phreatobacter aquaticus]